MCTTYWKIRSKNEYNKKFAYIQCGMCSECRAIIKAQWEARLKAEIEHYHNKLNYNIGFITLTYREECLPHIPRKFFLKETIKKQDGTTETIDHYKKIPCFSYQDIKNFTNCIRNYLWRKEDLKDGFRWLISSEYGEKKHRPHYHGLILFNPKIDHEKMYKLIEDAWCGTTNIIPNNPKHKEEKRIHKGIIAPFESFIPRDNYACGAYVAKYVCKDIEFEDTTKDQFKHLNKKQRNEIRHYKPFHKQSMGFGGNLLEGKNDNELLDILENGFTVTGETKRRKTPTYIREKILFTTQKKYNLQTHKHETVKKYSKFLFNNYEKVYNLELKKNTEMFQELATKEYWEKNTTIDNTEIQQHRNHVPKIINETGAEKLGYFYTNYFGLPYEKCKELEPWDKDGKNFFQRYNPCADMENMLNINKDYYYEMTAKIHWILGVKHLQVKKEKTEKEEKIENLRKFWQEFTGKTT